MNACKDDEGDGVDPQIIEYRKAEAERCANAQAQPDEEDEQNTWDELSQKTDAFWNSVDWIAETSGLSKVTSDVSAIAGGAVNKCRDAVVERLLPADNEDQHVSGNEVSGQNMPSKIKANSTNEDITSSNATAAKEKEDDLEEARCWESQEMQIRGNIHVESAWYGLASDPNMRLDITEEVRKAASKAKYGFCLAAHDGWEDPAPWSVKEICVRFRALDAESGWMKTTGTQEDWDRELTALSTQVSDWTSAISAVPQQLEEAFQPCKDLSGWTTSQARGGEQPLSQDGPPCQLESGSHTPGSGGTSTLEEHRCSEWQELKLQGPLEIESAWFGLGSDPSRRLDITEEARRVVASSKEGNLQLAVHDGWEDPAPYEVKEICVNFRRISIQQPKCSPGTHGILEECKCWEWQKLLLQGPLYVESALFGPRMDPLTWTDVTEDVRAVAAAAKDGLVCISHQASWQDPAPLLVKEIRVKFRRGGSGEAPPVVAVNEERPPTEAQIQEANGKA